METIYALSTAQGKAGVAVVRLSGPQAWDVVDRLTVGTLPEVRRASVRRVVDAQGQTLDVALILLFEAGASFTGEQSAEIHLHGSFAVVAAVMSELGKIAGARIAEPGEFTRRALLNDRLDMTEVVGLSDLLEAETEAQRREAMRVFQGGLRQKIEHWRHGLVRALALLEATIDFADEDVPVDVMPEVRDLVQSVRGGIKAELASVTAAQELRRGFEVAIVGPPNVGKSTLLNALAGREAALTSEIAGTTRDIVEVRMDLAGLPVTFLDTAGIRETADIVEQLGVDRAMTRAKDASLRVFLVNPGERPVFEPHEGDLVYQSKSDITGEGISAVTGAGIDSVIVDVTERLAVRAGNAGLVSRERDRTALVAAEGRLKNVESSLGCEPDELIAAEIYGAVKALEAVIGRVGVEDVLDEVFSSFCLGK